MTRTQRFARVVGAVIGTAALAAVPAPAQAHEMWRTDATNDVLLIEEPFPEEDATTVLDPDWSNGDITRVSARHEKGRVRVQVAYRDLREEPGSGRAYFHTIRLRTNKATYDVLGFSYEGRDSDDFALLRDDILRCRGLWTGMNLERNTVTVSVPRACLGNPRWVRVGTETYSHVETDHDITGVRIDTSHATGVAGDAEALTRLPLGRRLWQC